LGHHRAAIDLLQMADRHLARTETVDTDLALQVDKLRVRLGMEIRCGNVDLEFVLQSLIEGFGDLHGSNLLFALALRLTAEDLFDVIDTRPKEALRRLIWRTRLDRRLSRNFDRQTLGSSAWCGRRRRLSLITKLKLFSFFGFGDAR